MSTGIELPSVQSLLIRMFVRGQVLSIGTAFMVHRDGAHWLVTNRHNLAGRRSDTNEPMSPTAAVPDTVQVAHNVAGHLGAWQFTDYPLYDAEGRPLWLEHAQFGRAVDVVALQIASDPNLMFFPHSLEPGDPEVLIQVTTDVHVVGFPFGITSGGALAVWTRGSVASEYGFDLNDLPAFLIDARTRPGQSGSPVLFHSTGVNAVPTATAMIMGGGPITRFLGVYSGRINNESDLGVVWRARAVGDVISRGVRPDSN
ncbi:serine protease [Nocardioides sp. ChNu-99]|uniref:S1 family peptidase n=1 Tax=Nocardioides sp. ChNu-99 TaxID=2839897 RepID=UPI0024074309|nr:serine protease [Nocardioides sp. ChNu-99]MDF9716042.1 serine protease [Nocardioides sp. ChNu-99]